MKVELNAEEAQVLVNLLNVAVKAVGLEAAESALHFVAKIKQAGEAEKAAPEVVEDAASDA